MNLAIFGATGSVGSELLNQALAAGHDVRALARNPNRLPGHGSRLTPVQGDVKDFSAVKRTVSGCDAVLSTLGARRGDDPDTRRVGTGNAIEAMHQAGIRRLVVMGGFHLAFPGDPDNIGRRLIVPIIKLTGVVVEDTTAMGALIQASDLDWTVVRAPRVDGHNGATQARTGILALGPWNKVTRANVASFMLDCLADDTLIGQAPMICNSRVTRPAGSRATRHARSERRPRVKSDHPPASPSS